MTDSSGQHGFTARIHFCTLIYSFMVLCGFTRTNAVSDVVADG